MWPCWKIVPGPGNATQRSAIVYSSPDTVLHVAVQWYRVFDQALTVHDAIRVSDAVEQYLGRIPPDLSGMHLAGRPIAMSPAVMPRYSSCRLRARLVRDGCW